MRQPKIDEAIRASRDRAKTKAEKRGHFLGRWEWDPSGHCWRAWCKRRFCFAFALVDFDPKLSSKSIALNKKCRGVEAQAKRK